MKMPRPCHVCFKAPFHDIDCPYEDKRWAFEQAEYEYEQAIEEGLVR